jgi:hypothetical protein
MNRQSILKRAWATNANTSSFASKIPVLAEPTNDGVVALGDTNANRVRVYVVGLGADNDTASMRVIGWTRAFASGLLPLWIPVILGEFACTFSAAVGIAGSAVLNTERFADTITPVAASLPDRVIGAGTAINSDVKIFSKANDLIAYIEMPILGFEKLEFTFDQTLNTPTLNALYQYLDEA